MKRLVLPLLFLLLCLPSGSVTAKTLSRTVAVVNNAIITSHQLDQALADALAGRSEKQLSTEQLEQLKATLVEKLVMEKLLEQRIAELGLTVADSELETAIEDVQRKNGLDRAGLIRALEAQGMTMADYQQQIRKEILRYKLMGREVNRKILVTNSEVRDYFRAHIDDYRVPPTVTLRRISYPLPAAATESQLQQLQKQAAQARAALLQGEDFDQVVAAQEAAVSTDTMSELVEEELAEPLHQALKELEPGGVSEPLEMNGQLHLFQLTARNPGDPTLYDRVKGEIEETLRQEKTEARFEEWQQELRNEAYVDIRL
jgi:peptidyl-prolyl cis-trans isomerase SurA